MQTLIPTNINEFNSTNSYSNNIYSANPVTAHYMFYFKSPNHMVMALQDQQHKMLPYLPTREQQLSDLAQKEFDVLVIGGGATGCGVALDSVTRGGDASREKDIFLSACRFYVNVIIIFLFSTVF